MRRHCTNFVPIFFQEGSVHRRPWNKQELTHVMKNNDDSGIYEFGAYHTTNGRRASCLKFYVELQKMLDFLVKGWYYTFRAGLH